MNKINKDKLKIKYMGDKNSISFETQKQQNVLIDEIIKSLKKNGVILQNLRVTIERGSYLTGLVSEWELENKNNFEEKKQIPSETTISYIFQEISETIEKIGDVKRIEISRSPNIKKTINKKFDLLYNVLDPEKGIVITTISKTMKDILEDPSHKLLLKYASYVDEIINDRNIIGREIISSVSDDKDNEIYSNTTIKNISKLNKEMKIINEYIKNTSSEKNFFETEEIEVDLIDIRPFKNGEQSIKISIKDERTGNKILSKYLKISSDKLIKKHPTKNKAKVKLKVLRDNKGKWIKIVSGDYIEGFTTVRVDDIKNYYG